MGTDLRSCIQGRRCSRAHNSTFIATITCIVLQRGARKHDTEFHKEGIYNMTFMSVGVDT
jgi:hypothetical protein